MITTEKRFRNAFDYKGPEGEVNDLPSMTQPEMTMSLKTLIERFTRGGDVATFTPVYQEHDGFDENPEFEKMDATEKLQYALDLKMAIKRAQSAPPKQEAKPEPTEPVVEPAKQPEEPSEKDGKQ